MRTLLSVAVLVVAASATDARADILQFSSRTVPGTEGFTGEVIGGWSVVIDNNYDDPTKTIGYDPIDRDVDSWIQPSQQFFMLYFPLIDGDSEQHAIDRNFAPYPRIGDQYTAVLGFEDRIGVGAYAPNAIKFDDFIIDNPNGVTDYLYELSVDTDLDGTRDHTERGRVSQIFNTPDQRSDYWDQTIYPGADWRNEYTYGELTLTAIPEPRAAILAWIALGWFLLRPTRPRAGTHPTLPA